MSRLKDVHSRRATKSVLGKARGLDLLELLESCGSEKIPLQGNRRSGCISEVGNFDMHGSLHLKHGVFNIIKSVETQLNKISMTSKLWTSEFHKLELKVPKK